MKLTVLFISTFIILGYKCKEEKKIVKTVVKHEARAVHNKCTDKWAVLTPPSESNCFTFGYYFGYQKPGWNIHERLDSIDFAIEGGEYQFDDSLSAMYCYNKRANLIKLFQVMQDDSTRKADSIFKCQHTYN